MNPCSRPPPLTAPSFALSRATSLVLAGLLLASTAAGCSALVARTPAPDARPPLDCQGRYMAAGIDTVIAGAGLVGAAYSFAKRDTTPSEHDQFDPYAFMIGPLLLATMPFLLSALHGYAVAYRCTEIERTFAPTNPPPPPPS